MRKFLLLVEDNFYYKHVGVRNLIFSLYKNIKELNFNVDFVSYEEVRNKIYWYKIWIDEQSIINNFSNDDKWIEGSSNSLYNDYLNNNFITKCNNINQCVVRSNIGSNIHIEGYTDIVLTVPWLKLNNIDFKSINKVGIIYDIIPNLYTLVNKAKPFEFANDHCEGYKYYIDNCEVIASISNATQSDFNEFFSTSSCKYKDYVLPPMVPNYLYSNKCDEVDFFVNEKLNNIILASPLDPRKGLEYIPELINEIKDDINILYIYGKQRCSNEELKLFFNSLDKNINIIWFETISSERLSIMFSMSKFLIFPSDNEGLGLPLIEAQFYGCRVACTRFASASELLIDGYIYLDKDINVDANNLKKSLNDEYDYLNLKRKAREKFSENNLQARLKRIIL